MATGYTMAIADGIEFNEFVMQCARAFGALVMMRDDPMDAKIPTEFEPSSYHKNAIEKAEQKLNTAKNMGHETARVFSEIEYSEAVLNKKNRLEDKKKLKLKYDEMLNNVLNWTPPTSDHEELKNFMIQQIETSIDHDCDMSYPTDPILLSAEEWLRNYVDKCVKDLGYHVKEWHSEVNRCKERSEWVRLLRDSI